MNFSRQLSWNLLRANLHNVVGGAAKQSRGYMLSGLEYTIDSASSTRRSLQKQTSLVRIVNKVMSSLLYDSDGLL